MKQKSKLSLGDEIIKNIVLNRGQYSESTLVDKVCTAAQQQSYHRKNKFANSKQRSMFLDRLSCYCEFECNSDTRKYKIKRVFKYPKTKAEIKVRQGIYQCLTPLILDKVLNNCDGRWTIFSTFDLAENCCMFNRNYTMMKFNQKAVETDLKIPEFTTSEYFNKSDDRIDYYIRQCIKYLTEMNCVVFDEVHIIERYNEELVSDEENDDVLKLRTKEKHKATKEEMDLYTSLIEIASKKAGVRNNSDKWYGKTALRYQTELSRLFNKHKIKYVCRGFELWRVDTDRCKEILDSFKEKSMNQYRQEIGTLLKIIMDENAEERIKKRRSLDEYYLEHFKDLSDITLLYDAPDIAPRLPSAKSYEEKIQEQANSMRVRIMEVPKEGEGF